MRICLLTGGVDPDVAAAVGDLLRGGLLVRGDHAADTFTGRLRR